MPLFTTTQRNLVNAILPVLASKGIELGDILEALNDAATTGALAIQSDPADVDAVCEGASAFGWNQDSTTGLSFAWNAGRFHNGLANVNVAGGALSLTASVPNYIEVDRTGTVTANISAFTSGRLPLFVVTPGSSSILAGGVVPAKPLYTLIGAGGTTGAMLSTAAATKTIPKTVGAVAATTIINVPMPNIAGVVTGIRPVNQTAITPSDTDKWTFSAINKGTANAGTTPVLDTSAVNSTAATGGSALTANVQRALVLNSTPGNLNTNALDVIQITITKTGSPSALADLTFEVDLQISG